MQTLMYEDEETETQYHVHHHGDYSGEVIINRAFRGVDTELDIALPATLFLAVVADWVVGKQISELEQMSDQQILGLL